MLPSYESTQLLVLYLLLTVVFVFVERRRLGRTLARVGRPGAYFAVVSVCALLIAQTHRMGSSLYPYTSWMMYTHPAPSGWSWRVEFVRASGAREVIPVAKVMPGPNPRAAMRLITSAAARLEGAGEKGRAARREELESLLEGVAALDALRHAEDPVERIEIQRCRIEGGPPWGRESFACDPFFQHGAAYPGGRHAP